MRVDEQLIKDTYDTHVRAAGDSGTSPSDAAMSAAAERASRVASGELVLPEVSIIDELARRVDAVVRPMRRQRKAILQKEMEYILDALQGETILGRDDARLAQAFPVGDGRDKILLLWTADDWHTSAAIRSENAAIVTAASKIYGELAAQIVDVMVSRGLARTGDALAEAVFA